MFFHALFQKKFSAFHDDVIKWKHFPRYWPFVRGIHREQCRGALMFFFHLRLNKRLSKQSRGWWFETLPCVTVMLAYTHIDFIQVNFLSFIIPKKFSASGIRAYISYTGSCSLFAIFFKYCLFPSLAIHYCDICNGWTALCVIKKLRALIQ